MPFPEDDSEEVFISDPDYRPGQEEYQLDDGSEENIGGTAHSNDSIDGGSEYPHLLGI